MERTSIFLKYALTLITISIFYVISINIINWNRDGPYYKWFYIAAFNTLYLSWVSCYIIVVIESPIFPSKKYALSKKELFKVTQLQENKSLLNGYLKELVKQKQLDIRTVDQGTIRYCQTCAIIKPDRAKHCSTCGMCMVKMDHHCASLLNCIGLHNQKPFILLLIYLSAVSFLTSSLLYSQFQIVIEKQTMLNSCKDFCVSLLFQFSLLLGIFSFFHLVFYVHLVVKNRTLLEFLRKPLFIKKDDTFDKGVLQNLKEVMGPDVFLWFCPLSIQNEFSVFK